MIMINRTQTAATMTVTRVNVSPAREPKALEPPTPPNAPANPPPWPRWIRTSRMRKTHRMRTKKLRTPGNQVQKSAISTVEFLSCPNRGKPKPWEAVRLEETGIIGERGGGVKATFVSRSLAGHADPGADDGQELVGVEAGPA